MHILRHHRLYIILCLLLQSMLALIFVLHYHQTAASPDSMPRFATPNSSQPARRIKAENYLTLPRDFPVIDIITATDSIADGYIFVSPFSINWSAISFADSTPYLLILDNTGEPIFHRRMPSSLPRLDFKKQPNGQMSYTQWGGPQFTVLDKHYQEVAQYFAGNGRTLDIHEFLILSSGNIALMASEQRQIDMSALVPGGNPDALVTGLILQEIEPDGNVMFEWASLDHLPITDSTVGLTGAIVDYVHGNSIEVAPDGNWIISSRFLDEITKINRDTGAIMWRLGGKGNQFTFDPPTSEPFFDQHDARITADGTLTLFDNHFEPDVSTYARAVEYELDEINMIAKQIWEYRVDYPNGSRAMGSTRRLPNGNTFIGWGSMYPSITEVEPDGTVAFEMSFGRWGDPNIIRNSYRAFRNVWVGKPLEPPLLLTSQNASNQPVLHYSWNGATEVISYNIHAGTTLDDTQLVTTVAKQGFETQTTIEDLANHCLFQIEPVLPNGELGLRSNVVIVEPCITTRLYLPITLLP